jgi:hypothetical protein
MDCAGFVPSLIGTPVLDATGDLAGHVEDVLFDVRTHDLAWFVVDGRTIPATVVAACAAGYRLRCTVDVLADRSGAALDREAAIALCRRHGVLLPSAGPWAGLHTPAAATARAA